MSVHTSLKDCSVITLPTFTDPRGSLTLMDYAAARRLLPFIPKRSFWIHHTPAGAVRGEHAHRTCWEMVTAVSGAFHLTLSDGISRKDFILDRPDQGVIIPPMIWCRLWGFQQGTVCLTLASDDYDAEGYINDHSVFLKEARDDRTDQI